MPHFSAASEHYQSLLDRVVVIKQDTPSAEVNTVHSAFTNSTVRQNNLDLLVAGTQVDPLWRAASLAACREILRLSHPRCVELNTSVQTLPPLVEVISGNRLRSLRLLCQGLDVLPALSGSFHIPCATLLTKVIPRLEELALQDLAVHSLLKIDIHKMAPIHLRKLEFLSSGAHLLSGLAPGAFITHLGDLSPEQQTQAVECKTFYDTFFEQHGHRLEYLDLTGLNKLYPPPQGYYPDLRHFPNLRTLVARFQFPHLAEHLQVVRSMVHLTRFVFHCRCQQLGLITQALAALEACFLNPGTSGSLTVLDCRSLGFRSISQHPVLSQVGAAVLAEFPLFASRFQDHNIQVLY